MPPESLDEDDLSMLLGEHDTGRLGTFMGVTPFDSVEFLLLRLEELGVADLPEEN
jgi:hypothetical protein